MDKTKIFEAAGKYAAKGQLDKAAKEYQRILEEDTKDVRALQKLAEIYQKSGRVKESTDLMMRVAEGYTDQGFFLKAVAVYKQLLKSGIERIEVNQKLAQLYQQLGLVGDATQQFQLVANYFDQNGNIKESLAALRRMVELDPDNIASQVKLGELYAREQLIPEAVAELRKAAVYLKRNNRNEDYFRVLERIGQLAPDDVAAARELAQNYIAVADTKRALAKLQVCFRNDPKDVETLRLLARAFIDLGQEAKAVSVYRELGKVHHERGQTAEYRQALEKLVELSPDDPDALAALRELSGGQDAPSVPPAAPPISRPAAAARPAAAPAMPSTGRPSRPLGSDVSPAVAKILTETDVYLKYGLIAKAAEHIKKALIEDLDSIDAQEKLLVIQDKQNKAEEAIRTIERILELARDHDDQERLSEYTQELAQRAPDHPLVVEAAAAAELGGDDAIDPDSAELVDDFDEGVIINTDPTLPPAFRPVLNPAETSQAPWDRLAEDDQAVVVESSQGPGPAPHLDLGDDETFHAALDRATNPHLKAKAAESLDPFAVVSDHDPDDEVVVPDEEIPHLPPPIVEVSAAHEFVAEHGEGGQLDELPALEALAIEEHSAAADPAPLEEPEPEQPYEWPASDESAPAAEDDVYAVVDESQPEEFAAEEAPAEEAPAEEAPAEEAPAEQAYAEEFEAPAEAAAASDEVDDFVEECDEAEFLIQQGLTEDAQGVLEGILLAAPEHPRAIELLRSLGQAPEAEAPGEAPEERPAEQPGSGFVNLAADLASELDQFEPARPASQDNGAHSVEDVLAEFKKQLSVTVSAEDSQTHYDLGIAYKEMGLYDEALHEFEVSLEGRGRKRVIDCLTMLGVCQLEKGQPRAAIIHFEQALKTPGLTLEASKEAHYEIGHCHELLGEEREAYDHYARVFKADQTFRDVRERTTRLREKFGGKSGIQPPVNGATHSTGTRNGTHPTPVPTAAGGIPPAPGTNDAAENAGPRGGRGKIGYI